MGQFIETGYVEPGHRLDFTYPDGACVVQCECGWTTQLTSYPNPWIVLELRRRFDEHLAETSGFSASHRSGRSPGDH